MSHQIAFSNQNHICLPFMFLLFQLFFEDSVRNIQAGKRVGLQTVLVSCWNILHHLKYGSLVAKINAWIPIVALPLPQIGTSQRVKGADYALESIHNIREAIPELWEADRKSEVAAYSGNVAVETSVTA
jgi:putative hydrolase of the HAD superfamily